MKRLAFGKPLEFLRNSRSHAWPRLSPQLGEET